MDMDVSVEIHCEACGSANYSLPERQRRRRADPLQRLRRRPGHVGELKAALIAQALDHSAEALRRDLDRLLDQRGAHGSSPMRILTLPALALAPRHSRLGPAAAT